MQGRPFEATAAISMALMLFREMAFKWWGKRSTWRKPPQTVSEPGAGHVKRAVIIGHCY